MRDPRGRKVILRGDGYVYYLDYGIYICQILSHDILYVNYISIKLLEKEGAQHYETKRGRIRKDECENELIEISGNEKY